jgi:hypothetical protein
MTASRARNNDIGSERENSRIGVRRTLDLAAAVERPFEDFLPAIVSRPPACGSRASSFAVQQRQFGLI